MNPQPNKNLHLQSFFNTYSGTTNKNTGSFNPLQQTNQGFLSPQGGALGNRGSVYASTINTATSSSGGFGLGKLQMMGRTIKEDTDTVDSKPSPNSQGLTFKPNNDKGKLASSVIFQKNYDQDINRFPGFNVLQQVGTSKLDALFANKKQVQETQIEQVPQESAQDKRKREINAIKQELEVLNKRMETTVTKKEGESKPYFQLSSRKTNNPVVTPSQPQPQPEAPKIVIQPLTQPKEVTSFSPYAPNANILTKQAVIGQSSNEIKPIQSVQSPKGETGMFKKKNPYILEQTKNTEYAPKTFMLSPKGVTVGQGFKADPILPKNQQKIQIKAAQIIPQSSSSKKGLKKTESFGATKQEVIKGFKKQDFAIGKKMGKGQFGQVMLVQHKKTGFLCGMKVMSKKQIRQQKYVNQVARELSIQFYLNHRNVAPLYGYFEDEENVFLLIEYCTGGQLLQLLRKAHRMEQADTSPIIRQICEGLDYIHKQQIIHRDIKPENILFNFNTVKICDFGWAVHCGSGMRKTVSGSPLYYSPQIVQETEYDEKVDIWAIGMMTYECLLGKIPFRIYSQLDLNRIVQDEVKFPEYVDVTDDAKSFILGIMQKNPDDRMVMKDIFKHPFIRKYLNERKVAPQILQQFRRVLG